MKKINCPDCGKEFTASSMEDAMGQMMPHYMEDHKDIMAAGDEEKKKAWLDAFRVTWNETPEISS